MEGELYTYIIRGAFGVARFDNLGDARAFTAWNEWQNWLHVFMYIYQPFVNHANKVAVGKKKDNWYELYKSSSHKDG